VLRHRLPFFATCALVWVTIHHAHSAEKVAAAADRLGKILERQAEALAEVIELNALVAATAVPGGTTTPRFGR
jgi:hypothetical protein